MRPCSLRPRVGRLSPSSLEKTEGVARREAQPVHSVPRPHRTRAPLGAPQRLFCPRVRVSGFMRRFLFGHPSAASTADTLFGPPETIGPFPVQRAPRGVTVVSPDRVPRPPGSGVTSPARRRRIPLRLQDVPRRRPSMNGTKIGLSSVGIESSSFLEGRLMIRDRTDDRSQSERFPSDVINLGENPVEISEARAQLIIVLENIIWPAPGLVDTRLS